jgi:hypothetical protein
VAGIVRKIEKSSNVIGKLNAIFRLLAQPSSSTFRVPYRPDYAIQIRLSGGSQTTDSEFPLFSRNHKVRATSPLLPPTRREKVLFT